MKRQRESKKIFAAGLLLENRSCLVVGGGPVAAGKTELLIGSGATVTLVSPVAVDEIKNFHSEGTISWISREFQPSDLEGISLVFAATNMPELNREILDLCQELGILSCAVDKNWSEGDFITPATYRKDELTVAISTGGASCRRSKMIKESLVRHVNMIDSIDLCILGTDHNCLPLSKREAYHRTGESYIRTGNMLNHIWGVHEFLLLNTCNRVELIAAVSPGTDIKALVEKVLGFDTLAEGEYYCYFGFSAFDHLSRMLAGLYSQTPGENHIVAQVKDALSLAHEKGWSGRVMADWVSRGLRVSKLIRHQVDPRLKHREIEDVSLLYLEYKHTSLKRVMVLGTGMIGEGLVRRLCEHYSVIWVYYRKVPDISGFTGRDVQLVPMDDRERYYCECDALFAATASENYLIHKDVVPAFKGREVSLVDLSIPRNIDPETAYENISVIDMEDLKYWYRREAADMESILLLASDTVNEHRSEYEKILSAFKGRQS